MKKIFITLFLISTITNLSAEISVKSFRKLESDMTARIDAPKKDQNGDVCAIIKVVTTQTGFIWEPDGLGIVSAENKGGEYWLYVPFGAKRLTVKHPQLGVLRDYMYNIPIEKATVYEMVLISGRIETTVVEEITKQWLVITPQPDKAMIYINDVFVSKGEYQAQRMPDMYSYRVEAPLYHTEAGKLEISDAKRELKVNLKPAFGYLNINTVPEQDATIIIDGKEITKTTPATSDKLASGEHTVQVIKEMYQPAAQKAIVADGQTTAVNFNLVPNFAELSVTAPQQATIVINRQIKGKSSWKGRLSAGIYTVEVQMDKHHLAKQDIQLEIGDKKELSLQPTPIYGSVNIVTTPSGASINIDGRDYGTTPNTIKNLLVGDYQVVITKMGYDVINKSVTVNEKCSENLNLSLSLEKPLAQKTEISNTVKDIDGNEYNTVKIGNQTWMVENLRVIHYRNGEEIPKIVSDQTWSTLTTGAYCIAEYNIPKIDKYGLLYNWYAVSDKRDISPIGWHVASEKDWKVLEDFVKTKDGLFGSVAQALSSKSDWATTRKIDALGYQTFLNNATGLSALPVNARDKNGMYFMGNYSGYWWCSTQKDNMNACNLFLYYDYSTLIKLNNDKACGFSVRCVKDSNNENIEIINDNKIKVPVTLIPINNTNQVKSESTTKTNESPAKVKGSGYSPDYNSGGGYSTPSYNTGNIRYNSRSSTYKRK